MTGRAGLLPLLAAAVAALASPPAAEAGGAEGKLRISGTLQTVCSLGPLGPGEAGATEIREFCNTAHGFRVLVRHAAALGGRAVFAYGERETLASGSGVTEIFSSHHETDTRRLFRVSGVDAARLGRLSLTILPNE